MFLATTLCPNVHVCGSIVKLEIPVYAPFSLVHYTRMRYQPQVQLMTGLTSGYAAKRGREYSDTPLVFSLHYTL